MGKREITLLFTSQSSRSRQLIIYIQHIKEISPLFDLLLLENLARTMSATIISDSSVLISTQQPESQQQSLTENLSEVESVKCECCGLTEECTPAYIERVRERYHGKWICGLCAEAVKDEIIRATTDHNQKKKRLMMMISTEEAMARHINFCKKFVSSGPPDPDPTIHLITAMRQILRRSAAAARSTPTSPTNGPMIRPSALTRSDSCFPTLSG